MYSIVFFFFFASFCRFGTFRYGNSRKVKSKTIGMEYIKEPSRVPDRSFENNGLYACCFVLVPS